MSVWSIKPAASQEIISEFSHGLHGCFGTRPDYCALIIPALE
jgi:hypothetical protein